MGEKTSHTIVCPTDFLRHRPPFLFVDDVDEVSETTITGSVEFTNDKERWCDNEDVPSSRLVEAFAQLAGIHIRLVSRSRGLGFLTGVENASFHIPLRGPVKVGLTCERVRASMNLHVYSGRALANGLEVGRGDIAIHFEPAEWK